jgi:predicted ATPase
MSALRIALCGVSGSGKTTLMKKIAERYDLPICPVGSRSVAASMGFDNPYDTDKAGAREEFQHQLFLQKRAWEAEHDRFVSDRTHFDNLAYSMLHCPASVNQERFDEMVAATARYTHVFYLPREAFQNLGGDPHRVQSTTYHEAHDLLLEGLLVRYLVSTYDFHLLGVPVEQRAKTAFMFIDEDTP